MHKRIQSGKILKSFEDTTLKEKNEIIIFETDGLKGEPVVEINSIHKKAHFEKVEFVEGKDTAVAEN